MTRSAAAVFRWARDRAGYALALLPVLTDWIDSGHWPHYAHELTTEISIGLLIFIGVGALYRRSDRFQTLAETDPLTGLSNRRRFRQDLEAEAARARESGAEASLALIDVDQFKERNDRLGHEAGDEALRAIAGALQGAVRRSADRCYRLGGDEFAVLFRDTSPPHALEALKRGFAQVGFAAAPPLRCSVGVAALRQGADARDLVRVADALMYDAKHGRTRADAGARVLSSKVEIAGARQPVVHPTGVLQ
ncbi:MAG: GGDEF domain-containing protein [Archangium sp.]|nr:GGDEF domain-containing protein [Archangium sp.]